MIDDVLYVSTPYNRVVALDAGTGRELWTFDPKAYEDGQPPNGTGFVHRGVAAWRDGTALRIFMNSRAKLFCLDAKTGEPVNGFGEHGVVDLTKGLRWPVDPKRYTNTSPPVVYKNLVILGNGVGDRLTYRQDPPGDVRAFDARTGTAGVELPHGARPGRAGRRHVGRGVVEVHGPHERVGADEPRRSTRAGVSARRHAEQRLLRRAAARARICTAIRSSVSMRRPASCKWYFQVAHHGLWDYDPASAPAIVSMKVDGRAIDGVVQLTKQGFVFVFDRVTGTARVADRRAAGARERRRRASTRGRRSRSRRGPRRSRRRA